MTSFDRKHVLITGGSEGIGLALAEQCGRRGAAVSIVARSQSKLDRAAAHLKRLSIECATASADVADSDALLTAIAHLEERTAPVDIVVACAGYAIPGYVESQSADEYRREMEVNYLGTVHAVKAVLDGMLERGAGHVVAISSTAGLLGVFGYTAYCPTKYAVRGFADALRAEVAGRGINVSIVYPPDTDTPGFCGIRLDQADVRRSGGPTNRRWHRAKHLRDLLRPSDNRRRQNLWVARRVDPGIRRPRRRQGSPQAIMAPAAAT